MANNIVPTDGLELDLGTAEKPWRKVLARRVDVKSGSNTAVNTLQRDTAYNVDDIVYASELNARYYLLCVTAGTTASALPNFSGAESNIQITDGTVVWRVETVASQEKAVPTGCVQAYAGNTLPDGWLLCDGSAVSRTDYSDLYSVIGDTYGSGDGSTTFNLPDLIDKFVEGSATSGTEKQAGLPNIITTSPSLNQSPFGIKLDKDDPLEYHGALGISGSYYSRIQTGSTGEIAMSPLVFSAHNSNSIYGNSATVQPPALTMRYIIKY